MKNVDRSWIWFLQDSHVNITMFSYICFHKSIELLFGCWFVDLTMCRFWRIFGCKGSDNDITRLGILAKLIFLWIGIFPLVVYYQEDGLDPCLALHALFYSVQYLHLHVDHCGSPHARLPWTSLFGCLLNSCILSWKINYFFQMQFSIF